jgi:tetratricopeptide (TPR) repeat protein
MGPNPFEPGALVVGRFRIVREIAAGGMGVVYEAVDEKLHERRALKCARPGFAGHLPPEARHSLRVTHPNVCRVFEIHTAETPLGAVDFLSMEYVDGGTLAAALQRRGALPEPEARDIALQICAGVEAAHAQQLLHRDLKPANVLLTTQGGRTRAAVTDFGLARGYVPGEQSGDRAGTPAYLAPERQRGEAASVASDVYAIGVVLHELIAGQRPAAAADDGAVLAVDIPPRWRTVIARCVDRDPSRRYGSASAVAGALIDRAGTIRRSIGWSAAVLAPIVFVAWQVMYPAPVAARLAILPLESSDADAQATALVQGASADLSERLRRRRPRPPQLVVIPLENTAAIDASNPGVARERLGASHVLSGTIRRRGNQLQVHASIVDTTTKLPLRDWDAQYPAADPAAIVNGLTGLVAAAFKLPRQVDAEVLSPAAYPAYAEGVAARRRGGSFAVDAFERAIALDPRSVLPRAGLAEACYDAWVVSGGEQWLVRGQQALEAAQRLNPDSLWVRLAAGRLSLVPGRFERAAQEYQRAIELEPASAEAWNGLARSYQAIPGRDPDAVAAFMKAIELQPGYYQPLVDLGGFYFAHGNRGEAEKLWLRAVAVAPELRVVHANLGALYVQVGRYQEAERELLRALQIEPKLRAALNNLGALYQFLGRDAEAVGFLERARAAGADTPGLLQNLGDSYRRLGMPAAASAAYRRGRELADAALAQNAGDAVARARVAYFAMRMGELPFARRELLQALNAGGSNPVVIERAVVLYEAVGERDRALAVLGSAPPQLITDTVRHPDLGRLRDDPRLAVMLGRGLTK